jgi:hypothetical protein
MNKRQPLHQNKFGAAAKRAQSKAAVSKKATLQAAYPRNNSAAKPKPSRANAAALRDGYECPVCLELCAEPVKTPCGHFFCLQCQKKLLTSGNNACPMCRVFFDKAFKPQIDKEL